MVAASLEDQNGPFAL